MALRLVKLAARPFVLLALVFVIPVVLTGLFYGAEGVYVRRVLVADIKKKKLPVTEEMLRSRSLPELFLYDRYGLRALLAFKKYPTQTVLVYGLFGELPLLHTLVNERGDHKTVPAIAHVYANERFVCNGGDAIRNILTRLEGHLRASARLVEEVPKIVRATCILLKLYQDGTDFVQVREDGSVDFRFQGGDLYRSVCHTSETSSGAKLTALQLETIGRPSAEMAQLEANPMSGTPIHTGATLVEALGWNLFDNSISLVRFTRRLAPAIFSKPTTTNTISGFGYLVLQDPRVWPSAIVTWSRAAGKTIVVLQYVGWLFLVGIATVPSVLLYWFVRKVCRVYVFLASFFREIFYR